MRFGSRRTPRLLGAVAVLGAMAFVAAGRAHAQVVPPPVAECATAPRTCLQGEAKLKLDVARHALAWKWTGRGLVDIQDLSNPTIDTGYDLCVYDAGGALVVATGVPPAGFCDGRPCWRARPWGYQYRDRGGLTGGITAITLRVALARRDRFWVKAAGGALPLPAEEPALPVTVQLVRNDAPSQCWTSVATKLR